MPKPVRTALWRIYRAPAAGKPCNVLFCRHATRPALRYCVHACAWGRRMHGGMDTGAHGPAGGDSSHDVRGQLHPNSCAPRPVPVLPFCWTCRCSKHQSGPVHMPCSYVVVLLVGAGRRCTRATPHAWLFLHHHPRRTQRTTTTTNNQPTASTGSDEAPRHVLRHCMPQYAVCKPLSPNRTEPARWPAAKTTPGGVRAGQAQ